MTELAEPRNLLPERLGNRADQPSGQTIEFRPFVRVHLNSLQVHTLRARKLSVICAEFALSLLYLGKDKVNHPSSASSSGTVLAGQALTANGRKPRGAFIKN